ncbi:MAG: hypothetical protein A2Z72_01860 [Omnitrophica bacterium RBG_13_46_9]|nr:MAG: hypothetical protein A2Z72_01860 [Omnitrophica bacterium RBG_13_46_9]
MQRQKQLTFKSKDYIFDIWGTENLSLAGPGPCWPLPNISISEKSPMKTNLIYHVTPMSENNVWVDNINCLLKYIHVFNNKKIINIAVGDDLLAAEEVKRYFIGFDAEFITTANDPKTRETASLIRLLEEVNSIDSDEITFFAHTKGTTRQGDALKTSVLWYEYMYRYNLSDIAKVKKVLTKYPCCGCFKRSGYRAYNFPRFSKWHYSGTFFWFNNRALFSRNWREIENSRLGAEAYLSRFFSDREAYCLFMKNTYDLYHMDYWNEVVFPFEKALKLGRKFIDPDIFCFLLFVIYRLRKRLMKK